MKKEYQQTSYPAAENRSATVLIKILIPMIQLITASAVTVGAWFLLRYLYLWNERNSDIQSVILRAEQEPVGWLIVGVVLGVPAFLILLLAKALLSPLQVGMHRTALKLAAKESVSVSDLFSGYGKGIWSACKVGFAKNGILLFLRLLPLLGEMVSCAVILDKLADKPAYLITALRISGTVWLAVAVLSWVLTLSYSMTHFVLSDTPRMEAREALSESSLYMRGNKREFLRSLPEFVASALAAVALLCVLANGAWHHFESLPVLLRRILDLHFPVIGPFLLIFFVVEFAGSFVQTFFLTKQARFYRRAREKALADARQYTNA